MPRPRRFAIVIIVGVALAVFGMAGTASRKPVLLSISPDPTELRPRNYCIMNPFRDRSPERAAERYLVALRDGRTEVLVGLLDSDERERILAAERKYRIVSWRIGRRQDTSTGSHLMYWVERGNGYSQRFQREEVRVYVAGWGARARVVSYGAAF